MNTPTLIFLAFISFQITVIIALAIVCGRDKLVELIVINLTKILRGFVISVDNDKTRPDD